VRRAAATRTVAASPGTPPRPAVTRARPVRIASTWASTMTASSALMAGNAASPTQPASSAAQQRSCVAAQAGDRLCAAMALTRSVSTGAARTRTSASAPRLLTSPAAVLTARTAPGSISRQVISSLMAAIRVTGSFRLTVDPAGQDVRSMRPASAVSVNVRAAAPSALSPSRLAARARCSHAASPLIQVGELPRSASAMMLKASALAANCKPGGPSDGGDRRYR
jgi:hypothetical protein